MINVKKRYSKSGFTLVELLVVISIIGILIGLSIFGLQGARQASRDSKRKADLESIRSGIEIYKSDCNAYPISAGGVASAVLANSGTSLIGTGTPTSCAVANTYMAGIPSDPTSPNTDYIYASDGVTYEICSALEQGTSLPGVSCGGIALCGNEQCSYKVTNP